MLNISESNIDEKVNPANYESFGMLENPYIGRRIKRIISFSMAGLLLFLFLPWTQNIQTKGKVTTLRPDQRPQEVQATIGGKIEKWYVREGQHVSKGDTLLYISEISSEYFDPNLVDRTQEQITSKTSGIRSYESKVNSLDDQIMALNRVMKLKTESYRNKVQQAQLKINSDSMDYEAAKVNYSIAEAQFNRQQELYDQGLKSLTDLESRKMKLQEALAQRTAAENRFLASKNQLVNATIELSNIRNEYGEKISKAESEKFTALSDLYNTEAEVAKIQNKLSNYFIRSGFYYIVEP
jgi:multidrug efflux pump subunit AcrA (membrane-fusion protein)